MVSVVLFWVGLSYSEDLELRLESEYTEYVYREPVKFCLEFNNVSNSSIYLPHYASFEGEMKFIYMDISYPDGSRQLRAVRHVFEYGVPIPAYKGMEFKSGDKFQVCYYPNQSLGYDPTTLSYTADINTHTFYQIGEYKIKFAYMIPEIYQNIYSAGHPIYSNEMVIRVTAPSIEEIEILNAYWIGGDISFGDNSAANEFNRDELEKVVNKYPDNPMIKYAMFGLAIEIGCSRDRTRDMQSALALGDELIVKYPNFRYYEIQEFRLRYLILLGDVENARRLYKKLLRSNRNLICSKSFVSLIAAAEYGWGVDNPLVSNWKRNVSNGNTENFYNVLIAE